MLERFTRVGMALPRWKPVHFHLPSPQGLAVGRGNSLTGAFGVMENGDNRVLCKSRLIGFSGEIAFQGFGDLGHDGGTVLRPSPSTCACRIDLS